MRHWFGGNVAAVNEVDAVDGTDDVAQLAGGLTVLFYNEQTGGTQYTDLLDLNGDPVTGSTTSDGTDGWGLGVILPVQLDDGIGEAYASVDGGPRFVVTATDTGGLLEALSATYAAHASALNPHGTGLGDLTDAAVGTAESRTDGHVLQWDSDSNSFVLAAPDAVAGAVMLDPGASGNVVTPNSGSEDPWLEATNTYSAGDDNPDFYVLYTRNASSQLIKVWWHNGNMEARAAPSLPNRVAFRVFENAESQGGASTQRVFEVSTNPTNTANREPLLGVYGTGHSTQPGWAVATRVLAGLLGVRPGGSYNSLTAYTFRGQRASSGPPTTGTWIVGDVVMDSLGHLHLCSVAGTPGTWLSPTIAATSFATVTPGTNMTQGSVTCGVRLELGANEARLRGTLAATGSVSAGATIGTVPSGYRPLHEVNSIARYTGGGARITISTAGLITLGSALSNTNEVWLDSLTYDLSA
jgi:hypothetical protein